MMPPNEKRRPLARGNGALKIAGQAVGTEKDSEPVALATTCPLACSPSCAYRCPVILRDAVLEYVAELVVTS